MIVLEFLYFYIHQINRITSKILTPKDEASLFKYMVPRLIAKSVSKLFDKSDEHLLELFGLEYNNSEVEYSRSEVLFLPPDENKPSLFNSLLLRITSVINEQLGITNEVIIEMTPKLGSCVISQMDDFQSGGNIEILIYNINIPKG